jgi:hypothetical protein
MSCIKYEEKLLLDAGHKPAVDAAALDQESNSGAHMSSESFSMYSGEYKTEQTIEDGNMVEDNTPPWGSVDSTPGV